MHVHIYICAFHGTFPKLPHAHTQKSTPPNPSPWTILWTKPNILCWALYSIKLRMWYASKVGCCTGLWLQCSFPLQQAILLYVCAGVQISLCVFTHIHTCTYAYAYVEAGYMCMQLICRWTKQYAYMSICACMCICRCTYVCVNIHTSYEVRMAEYAQYMPNVYSYV